MAGDRRAEEELVQRYSRGVSTIIQRMTGDHSLTEDLHQDTFRIVIGKIRNGDVREPEKLSGFIRTVARNLAREHYRRRPRPENHTDIEAAAPLADPQASQLDQVLRQEKSAIARRIIGELRSNRDREVLFRFYIAEDEKEQICRDLGLTDLQFNQVLFRARQRYKALYEKRARELGLIDE